MEPSGKQIAQRMVNRFHDKITASEIMETLKKNVHIGKNADIDVTVKRGTATLSGAVSDWAEYQVAYELARANVGVTRVNLKLFVKKPREEEEKFAFDPEKYYSKQPINN